MDIMTAKSIVLVTLFILTFIFSMLPLKLVSSLRHTIDPIRRARFARIISLLSCFAGGVFMATGLLDLFPEVDNALSKAMVGNSTPFPVAEFTVAFGFFLVLILEQIVLDCKEQRNVIPVHTRDVLSTQDLDDEIRRLRRLRSFEESSSPLLDERRQLRRHGSLEGISGSPLLASGNQESPEAAEAHSTLRSFLLLVALSLHSLFEGVAIGLQPNVASVIQIFVAVILHKVIIAFSLGLNLVQSELSLASIIKSNLLFCLTTPFGMGIAMGLEEFGKNVDSSIVNGVLQGLACGTFFYVTFFEVLPHELNHGGDRLRKLLAILLGFSVVCGVLFLEPADDAPPGLTTRYLNSVFIRSRNKF